MAKVKHQLFTLLIIVISSFTTFGQPPCSNETDPPGNSACEATPICNFDGYCGRTLSSYAPVTAWPELVQAIKDETIDNWGIDWLTLENDSYLKFIASSPTISFNVYVYDCDGGLLSTKAIQVIFFKASSCNSGPVEVVYTNKQMEQQGPAHTVTVNGLTPGDTYYILIDGYSGRNCGYTFEAIDGVAAPGVEIDLAPEITVCNGETITATASGGEGDYSWDGPSGLSSTNGSTVEITAPNTPGTYTYTVESVGGNDFCPNNSQDILTVIVDDCNDCNVPNPNIEHLHTCDETSLDLNDALTASTGQAGVTFHASSSDANNNINPIDNSVSSSNSYWVRIQDNEDADCYEVYEIQVSFSALNYTATIEDEACGENNGKIIITPTGGNAPYTYSIDNGANTQNNGAFENLSANTYQVLITDENGCEIEGVEIINNIGAPEVNAPNDIEICIGESVTLTANNPENATISWDNGITDGESFIPTSPGTYTYTVTATLNDCSAMDIVTVIVHDNPVPTFEADITEGCSPLTVTFTNTTGANSNDCSWDFGDGQTATGCGSVTHTFNNEGAYSVTLTVQNNIGCEGTTTKDDYITVIEGPTAYFSADPTITTIPNTEVEFTNESTGATDYSWNFGDGSNNVDDVDPTHIFPMDEQGVYTVILTASNGDCSSTYSATIAVKLPGVEYEIPNIFTPNGDGNNDYFKFVEHKNIKQVDMFVVNRWNNTVFKSDDIDFMWNGKINNSGAECTEGVYFYVIKITDFEDNEIEESGFVHLKRGK